MLIYFAATALSAGIAAYCAHTTAYRQGKRLLLMVILSAMPMLLISGFRYGPGTDFPVYINIFNDIKSGLPRSNIERGYYWLNRIIGLLGGDYRWMLMVTSAIFMLFTFAEVLRSSPYPALSVFLLLGTTYYFASFNGIRQMCGAAILLFSLRYVEQKKLLWFAICVALATLFHSTCIVYAVIYPMRNVKMRPFYMVASSLAVFAFGPFLGRLINAVMAYTKYEGYADAGGDGANRWIALLIQIALIALASWQFENRPRYRIYYNLQILALWVSAVDSMVSWIRRLQWTFGLAAIVMVPMAIYRIKDRRVKAIVIVAVCIAYTLYVWWVCGVAGKHNVLPYQTYLFS